MKKTYNITVYLKSFNGKSAIPSSIVVTASDEKDVIDFVRMKKEEIMKNDDWQSRFASLCVGVPIIDYEEIEVVNL